jgi:hypothetical protein
MQTLNLNLGLSLLQTLRPCPRNGASWRAGVGRVRRQAILNSLLDAPSYRLAASPCQSISYPNSLVSEHMAASAVNLLVKTSSAWDRS